MASQKKEDAGNETFESRFARLQEIVRDLESGALSLEDGVALYKEGMALSQTCREQLAKARHEITLLSQEGPAPFAPMDGAPEENAPGENTEEAPDEG